MRAGRKGKALGKAEAAVRRRVARQLAALGWSVRLLPVDANTRRRWRNRELTPSALAQGYLSLLVLLQEGGIDMYALGRGRVQAEPLGPLAPPRWDDAEAEEDVDDEPELAPAVGGGALEALEILAPPAPLEAPPESEPEKEQALVHTLMPGPGEHAAVAPEPAINVYRQLDQDGLIVNAPGGGGGHRNPEPWRS